MLRARLGLLVVLLCIFGGAVADSTDAPVVLTHGATRVRVSVVPVPWPDTLLRIKATRDGRSASWNYPDLVLDPEPTGEPVVEIRELRGVPYLFVHAYSGGASCCWSLLVVDLGQFKPLGEFLSSKSSIEVRQKVAACGVEASYWPLKGDPGESALRCFDGAAFRKARR